MIDEIIQQGHKLKFERKALEDQRTAIAKQTQELLKLMAKSKQIKPGD